MTLQEVKRLALAKHPPLSPFLLKIRMADPALHAASLELYARRRAAGTQRNQK